MTEYQEGKQEILDRVENLFHLGITTETMITATMFSIFMSAFVFFADQLLNVIYDSRSG